MHNFAESGVASHWRYKEGSKASNAVIEEKLHFFSEFVNDNKDVQDEEYIENLKKEVFENNGGPQIMNQVNAWSDSHTIDYDYVYALINQ